MEREGGCCSQAGVTLPQHILGVCGCEGRPSLLLMLCSWLALGMVAFTGVQV